MISFHDLKNYIINDPLSDWFEKINEKYNAYESTEPSKFEIMLKEKKYTYKALLPVYFNNLLKTKRLKF